MKGIVLSTASLLLMTTVCFAGPHNYKGEVNYKSEVPIEPVSGCCTDKPLLPGFYIGGGVGYDVYKFRQNTLETFDGITTSFNPPINAKGWNGTLFLGYGVNLQWFYLGAEISGNDTNVDGSYTLEETSALLSASYGVKVKTRYSYGAGLLPGVRVNDNTLFYGRVGYLRTSFRATESAAASILGISTTTTQWGNGFNYGLGIETSVAQNISIRGEYTYTSYSTIRLNTVTSVTPANNEVVLSLIYHLA